MADLAASIAAANIRRVTPRRDETGQGRSAVAITQGQVVYLNSDGQLALADGSAAGTAIPVGIAAKTVQIGQALSFVKRGKMDGWDISGLSYGDYVYLSDTAGALADAAGTVSFVLGQVVASTDDTPQKQLYIEINYSVPGV